MALHIEGVLHARRALTLAGGLFIALLSACGSQAGSPSSAGEPAEAGVDAAAVTFTEVYATVLKPCTSCHAGFTAQFIGLDMGTQATAYKNLVGASGTGNCGGKVLVVRGSAATSLLYAKVTNPTCGSLMPQNAQPLPQTSLDLLKTWIDEGAPND